MTDEINCRQELSKWFGSAVSTNTEVMRECLQICSNYNLSGETLFFQWEAFSYNNVGTAPSAGRSRTIQTMNLDGAKALRAHVARETAKANERRNATVRARGGTQAHAVRARRDGTPNKGAPSQSVAPRSDRIISNTTLSVTFVGPSAEENMQRTYRYMFEKISERSEALDDRIEEISDLVRGKYDIDELGDPSSVTEDVVTVVGRLCRDSEIDAIASSSKLTPTNLVLEASRISGSGDRIPLKFDPDFNIRGVQNPSAEKSLFPGEILALRGKNGGGGWFSVNEILLIPPACSSPEKPIGALTVLISSGPYTSGDNLDFEPFLAVIDEAKSLKPNVVLLLGPFIDTAHVSIKSVKLSSPPQALFQQAFLNPILSLLQQNPGTLVLLVPHVRDILSSHAVFPQGVVEGDFGNLPPSIKVLPNPCVFSINDIRFGVSTVDVLYHLKNQQYIQRPQQQRPADETAVPPVPQDVMANLCRHVLEQRSFYPVFPVPFELSSDVNLDVSHSEHLKIGEPAPNVLVLPSILRQFSKNVEGTIFVNPSAFGKSHTVAQLHIFEDDAGDGKMWDSTKVNMKHL